MSSSPIITTGDGSPTLHSSRFGETYHSIHGALAEARHVFLEASGVRERLEEGRPTRVLEMGFGTGLNFLLAASLAERTGTALYYESYELDPLPSPDLAALGLGRLTEADAFEEALIGALGRREESASSENSTLMLTLGPVELRIKIEDATSSTLPHRSFDAVFHDAFSPRVNPELWSEEFLGGLAHALRPGGRLVTYSVAGEVRRRLAATGLEVTKSPGPPGGKREMLTAVRPGEW